MVETSEFVDEAEASHEVNMIATNIKKLKIKTSEASRIREWSNIGGRFGEAALDSLSLSLSLSLSRALYVSLCQEHMSFVKWGDQNGDAYRYIDEDIK